MGKQVLFRMSECDEKRFSELLKEKFNVKFISSESDKEILTFYDDLAQINSIKSYIWNEDFDFEPKFQRRDNGIYELVTTGMPIIEYSAFRRIYSNLNTSRIYWDTDILGEYDPLEFNQWFKKCAEIIRKNAMYIEKGGRNIYYWEDYIRSRSIKRSYWIKKDNYLCLNVGTNCVNNCKHCVRDECIPLPEADVKEITKNIIEEFNRIYNNEAVIFGAYSEPLSSNLIKTIDKVLYEINNISKEIIIITNGLTYIDYLSEYQHLINIIYVLYPGADIEEYAVNTNSKYGKGAKRIIESFVNNGKKLGFDIRIERSYRGEILNRIIVE